MVLYLDNIIVIVPDFDAYLQMLKKMLKWLQAGFKLKRFICDLLQSKVRYLSYIQSEVTDFLENGRLLAAVSF